MKIAYGILGLGLSLLALGALGIASGSVAVGGLLAVIVGGFAVVIVLEEQDLASEAMVPDVVVVDAARPQSSRAA